MADQPSDREQAEQSVIGAICVDHECLDDVTPIISADCFLDHRAAEAFEAAQAMRRDSKPIDSLTLRAQIESQRNGSAAMPDPAGFLTECVELVPHARHADYYARMVREAWVRREVRAMGAKVAQEAQDPTTEVKDLIGAVQERLNVLDERTAPTGHTAMSDLLLDLQGEIETGQTPGVRTGFEKLDEMSNGLRPGNMVVVGARPSQGKTAFAGNIALNAARRHKRVLFFSVEQSAVEMAQRFVAMESGMSLHKLRGNDLQSGERDLIMNANNALADLPIDIVDANGWTTTQIAACARRQTRQSQVDLVIVDYLQLVEPEDRRIPREQQVAMASRAMKRTAKEVGAPIIVLAQLNREIEKRPNKRPLVSDLRESGTVEQDADMVWLIHRPSEHDPDQDDTKVLIIVGKHRNGPKGDVELDWTAETMRLRDPQILIENPF